MNGARRETKSCQKQNETLASSSRSHNSVFFRKESNFGLAIDWIYIMLTLRKTSYLLVFGASWWQLLLARVTIADQSSHRSSPSSEVFGLEFPDADSHLKVNNALRIWKKAFDSEHFEQWKDELAKVAPLEKGGTVEAENERHLQGGTTRYTSNYLAKFKYQLGSFCAGTTPIVALGCGDGGEIALSRVGDPATSCAPSDSGDGLICTTACADRRECSDIFITTDFDDETYGEIYFTCSGGNKRAAAGFALTGSQSGTCSTSTSIFSDNFQFLHLQLGVFCFDAAIDGAYDFSSQFFDCSEDSGAARIPIDKDIEGRYTCIAGESCQFSSCEVDIPSFFVGATAERRDACYTTEATSQPFPPSPPPSPSVSPQGDYSIRYQAGWSLSTTGSWCDLQLPVLSISCGGNGTITILETSHSEISCSQDSNSLITCQETCSECDHFISSPFSNFPDRDEIGSVTFSCEGISFDDIKATVEYPPATYSCSSNIDSTLQYRIAHNVKLGVFCGSALLGGDFNFAERFSECGLGNDWNIDVLDTGDLYCIESAPFFLRDLDSFEVAVSSAVSITSTVFRDDCYNFVGDPTEAPVPAPTNAPVAPPPTNAPVAPPPTDGQSTPAPMSLLPAGPAITPAPVDGTSESPVAPLPSAPVSVVSDSPNPAPSSTSPPGNSSAKKVTSSYVVIFLSLLGLLPISSI